MRYRITHTTDYRYNASVRLKPQTLRLCPRSDGAQWLDKFTLSIYPSSAQQRYFLDVYGNTCCYMTTEKPLDVWQIKTISEVRTTRENPFDYLAEPWAVQLPIDYPSSLFAQLRHYIEPAIGQGMDDAIAPNILSFTRELRETANNNIGYFLTQLAQQIPKRCTYEQRTEGMPQAAAFTLEKQSGTCRDFAVLFMAVCRAVGLAARFVSGYQEGDLEKSGEDSAEDSNHDLHAWAEVYIPGGGWRGFDPTLGLAVGDRHIAIAAALNPQHAAPVSGTVTPPSGQQFSSPIVTTLSSDITITAI